VALDGEFTMSSGMMLNNAATTDGKRNFSKNSSGTAKWPTGPTGYVGPVGSLRTDAGLTSYTGADNIPNTDGNIWAER
jgi:hypothetical protein